MAVILPGPLISDVRGRVGDLVFERNAGGLYVRSKGTVTQDVTDPRTNAHDALAACSAYYRLNLTSAERLAWDTYAQLWPDTDRWGRPKVRTGQQAFVALNFHYYLYSQTIAVTEPPTVPPLPKTTFTAELSQATQILVITPPIPNWPTPAGQSILYAYQGQPVNGTRNQFSGPFRYADTHDEAGPGWPAFYQFTIPFAVTTGQAVWFRMWALWADPIRESRLSVLRVMVT